ncbi:MAG TPA: hypothetical protein VLL48_13840 [Longimicrobiales bacterium]|nr:hypothetical protein [Longimicrobiales bacterium]
MSWLRRLGRAPPPEPEEEEGGPRPVERAAPGISALFEGVRADRSHTVLDFGPASEGSLELYSRYAQRIRFADLLTAPPGGSSWTEALDAVPRYPGHPYDLVLAWNLLDRMAPEQRPAVVERLADLTGPGARLYMVMDSSGGATTQPLRFTLQGTRRVSQEPAGPPHPAWRRPLPAEVERLVAPFRVVQAYVLRLGMREYVAVKG